MIRNKWQIMISKEGMLTDEMDKGRPIWYPWGGLCKFSKKIIWLSFIKK